MADRIPAPMIREHQRAERADFLALLLDLKPEDWQRTTPCTGWTVADVAAHVLAWEQLLAGATLRERWKRTLRLFLLATTSRFNVDRTNDRLQHRSPHEPTEILAALTAPDVTRWKWRFDHVSRGAQLAEYVVHHEDVRAALGRPRVIPDERLDIALDGVMRIPGLAARTKGASRELTGRDRLLYLAGR